MDTGQPVIDILLTTGWTGWTILDSLGSEDGHWKARHGHSLDPWMDGMDNTVLDCLGTEDGHWTARHRHSLDHWMDEMNNIGQSGF